MPRQFLSRRPSLYIFISLLLSHSLQSVNAKKPKKQPPNLNPPTDGDLNAWIRARCSDKEFALWAYEGALFDPLDGRRIATVEGLEMVRCVATIDDPLNPENKKQYLDTCGDLEVGPLISSENATFDQVSTILSRKFFCYQSPDNPNQLLSSIRLRPNSPLRAIPARQAVAAYDTATTFIARGKDLIAHTEWPDRQSIWGFATRNFGKDNSSSNKKDFDFTVYARQKSARKKADQLFDLSKPPNANSNNSGAVVASPRRAKLIEFGTGSSRGKDKFGARETYSYSNIPSTTTTAAKPTSFWQRIGLQKPPTTPKSPCQVRYSRYGEGPPFFGPGRVCSLELQGRRIDSLEELSPLTASLLSERIPNFYNNNFNSAALDGFRSGPALQILPGVDEKPDFWLPDYLREKGLDLWSKWKPRRNSCGGKS